MVYQSIDELRNKISQTVGEDHLSEYEEYITQVQSLGLFDLLRLYELDIFIVVFKPLISMGRANMDSESIRTTRNNHITRVHQNIINRIHKADELQEIDVIKSLYEMTGKMFYLRSTKSRDELLLELGISTDTEYQNEEAVALSLSAELNMKLLYLISSGILHDKIQQKKIEFVKGTASEINVNEIAREIFTSLMTEIKTINTDHYETAPLSPEASAFRSDVISFTGNPDVRFSGHHLFALLNNLSPKDQILIKHQLITMSNRGYFLDGRIPSYDEVIDANDYLLTIREFDNEEELKNWNAEILRHSDDNVLTRYLTRLIEDEDMFHLAFATATLTILRYRIDEITGKHQEDEQIITEEERVIFDGLTAEAKEFVRFIKNNINNPLFVSILDENTKDIINNYINRINTVNNIESFEKLNHSYQEWINKIQIKDLSEEQFDYLVKLDQKFVYDRLPLQSKVMFKRRLSQQDGSKITKSDIMDADAFDDVKMSIIPYIYLSYDPISTAHILQDLKAELASRESLREEDYRQLFDSVARRRYDSLQHNLLFMQTKARRDKNVKESFNQAIRKMEVKEDMIPMTYDEAFFNYCLCFEGLNTLDFDISYVMYKSNVEAFQITNYCRERGIKFYPELFAYPDSVYNFHRSINHPFHGFYERIDEYKKNHNNMELSPEFVREHFIDEESYKRLLEEERREKAITGLNDAINVLSNEDLARLLEIAQSMSSGEKRDELQQMMAPTPPEEQIDSSQKKLD